MRFIIAVALGLFILVYIEVQIIDMHNQRRKEKCETVVDNKGYVRKASDYEYYSCLGR